MKNCTGLRVVLKRFNEKSLKKLSKGEVDIMSKERVDTKSTASLMTKSLKAVNSRVVGVDGPPAGGPALDGLHGGGVQGLLLGHGPLLVAVALAALRALQLPLPLRLVHVVDPEQQAVVHDLKALQHL